jgi:hypothetical protein
MIRIESKRGSWIKAASAIIPALALAVAALAGISAGAEDRPTASPFVPLTDPVYDLITVLPLPGIVDGVNTAVRPYTETQVTTLLAFALAGGCRDTLLVRRYLDLFTQREPERAAGDKAAKMKLARQEHSWVVAYPTFYSTMGIQDSAFSILGYTPGRIDSLSTKRGFNTSNDVGLRAIGSLYNWITYFNGRITTRYSQTDRWAQINDPKQGIFQATIFAKRGEAGPFVGSDDFITYLAHPGRFLDIKIGNDVISWGHSKDRNLIFSPLDRPFFNVQVSKNLGALDFQYVWGRLTADSSSQKRYVYAKHFNYQPFGWLTLGFSDMVITINRDFEPIYLFPFLPAYFSQHFIGDPDNVVMSFDVFVKVKRFAALYGELFLDDLTNLAGIFKNSSADDKWACLLGAKAYNPIPRVASVLTAEFTQIEPWVYTTSALDNKGVYNYPVHFGRLLGNPLGPHSRAVRAELEAYIGPKLSTSLQVQQIWKGDSAGSSPFDVNPYTNDTLASGEVIPRQLYQTKEYRFKRFVRDRTVVSLRLDFRPKFWWTLYGSATAIRERAPHEDNALQVELGTTVNY